MAKLSRQYLGAIRLVPGSELKIKDEGDFQLVAGEGITIVKREPYKANVRQGLCLNTNTH